MVNRSERPGARRSGAVRLAVPAVAVAVVALLREQTGVARVALLAAFALAVIGAAAPYVADRFGALVTTIAKPVVHAIEVALSAAVFALLLVPWWAVARLLGMQPLDRVPTWRPHGVPARISAHPRRLPASQPFTLTQRTRSPGVRLRLAMVVVLVLGAVT